MPTSLAAQPRERRSRPQPGSRHSFAPDEALALSSRLLRDKPFLQSARANSTSGAAARRFFGAARQNPTASPAFYPEADSRWSTQLCSDGVTRQPRPTYCLPVIPSQRTSAPASSGAFFRADPARSGGGAGSDVPHSAALACCQRASSSSNEASSRVRPAAASAASIARKRRSNLALVWRSAASPSIPRWRPRLTTANSRSPSSSARRAGGPAAGQRQGQDPKAPHPPERSRHADLPGSAA